MRIRRFNESTELKTFQNTYPKDIGLMEDKEIIDLISNTFQSKVISIDPNWIVIESEWEHIDENDEFIKLQNRDLIGKKFKIFFHIFKDDFLILRGDNEKLEEYLNEAKRKFPNITQTGGTEGSSMIIRGRRFPNLLYAFAPIPKNKESVFVDGEYYSLSSMSCSTDIRIQDKTIAYFSNLLIGSSVKSDYEIKRDYPGMDRADALKKSIEDRINQNPDLFRHLRDK